MRPNLRRRSLVLFTPARAGGTRHQIAWGSLGAFLLRVYALILGMLATLVLARALGPSELGTYAWALAVAATLQLGASFGLDRLATREMASLRALHRWSEMRGFLRRAPLFIVVTSIAICGLAAIVGFAFVPSQRQGPFLVAVALIPILALTTVRQGALTGLGRVVAARLPEDVFRPAIFLGLLALCWGVGSLHASATSAMVLQTAAAGAALIVGVLLLRRSIPREVKEIVSSRPPPRLLREAMPLALVGAAFVLLSQLDIILLGLLSSEAEVGLYAIAYRVAQVVGLAEFAVNAAFMPVVSRLFAQGRLGSVADGAPAVAAAGLGAAMLLAIPLLIAPGAILGLFGESFKAADIQLRLLAISYVVSAAWGLNGTILAMTRLNRPVIVGSVLALAVNVVLNLVLIPVAGGDGAAIAWLTTTMIWNAFLAREVRRSHGLKATPFALISARHAARHRT